MILSAKQRANLTIEERAEFGALIGKFVVSKINQAEKIRLTQLFEKAGPK